MPEIEELDIIRERLEKTLNGKGKQLFSTRFPAYCTRQNFIKPEGYAYNFAVPEGFSDEERQLYFESLQLKVFAVGGTWMAGQKRVMYLDMIHSLQVMASSSGDLRMTRGSGPSHNESGYTQVLMFEEMFANPEGGDHA